MYEPNNKLSRWFGERKAVRLMLLAALLALAVIYSKELLAGAAGVIAAAEPLLIGAAAAYVLEIYIDRLDDILFPRAKNKWLIRSRRWIAIGLSVIIMATVVVLLIFVIIPGLAEAVTLLARELPRYFATAKEWTLETFRDVPAVRDFVEPIELDWNMISDRVIKWATGSDGSSAILSSTMSVLSGVTGGLANFFISFIFMMFLLTGRKVLRTQFDRFIRAALEDRKRRSVGFALGICNRCFSGFIVGQTLWGLVSGVTTWLGMRIFGMPYALVVGVLCGTCMLIPIIGGYIGGAVGTFLVFTAAPSMALWFLLYIILLQTLEGNLVYPRLLGSSMGLPGLWVLAAVTMGGGLGGIPGMLLAVPLAATVYNLIKSWVTRKETTAEGKLPSETQPEETLPAEPAAQETRELPAPKKKKKG